MGSLYPAEIKGHQEKALFLLYKTNV